MSSVEPSLVARRRAATEMEIAHAAARLFTERGAAGTTAEAIAAEAGLSLRSFYRYFRTKEDAVRPLLLVGAEQWRARLSESTPAESIATTVENTISETLHAGHDAAGRSLMRGLLRASREDPDLAAVWYRVNGESEEQLVPILQAIAPGNSERTCRLVAAAATSAIRLAYEMWARGDETDAPVSTAVEIFRSLSAGIR
ncbi:TetR/AcrR family transcriptional regulator [Microbacterium aquimaris]|uniref:TetR/AcrR family transcriptional regulator n=1 Tax=Microbacterium aquimaris TaxID=459816 RepID=UPI002AD3EE3E|nr:TetR/AcrR family transcriptional regulator [Microbacterium aquimaris]MDZ8275342.1 TetR/AcrR family transcriptional regulator [Microbacterium aquimaris]